MVKFFYAVDTLSPLAASFIDRKPAFIKRCDLTRLNAFYTAMVSKLLFDQDGATWPAEHLASLQSYISGLNTVAKKTFALRCLSCLF